MDREVLMPWPISGCFETMITLLSGVIRMKALGSNLPLPFALALSAPSASPLDPTYKLSSRPPLAAAQYFMN
jgi:hypothetical protein